MSWTAALEMIGCGGMKMTIVYWERRVATDCWAEQGRIC